MYKGKEWLKEALVGIFDENDFSTETGFNVYVVEEVDELVDQLEEPEQEKVVVPDFIAEYIESLKHRGLNFYSGYRHAKRCSDNGKNNIQEWLDSQENLEIFARAWLDGYSVEKESQWVVKTGKNWFFKNFESVGEYNYQAIGTGSIEEAKKFKDKLEAESVALLSDGEVEEITE